MRATNDTSPLISRPDAIRLAMLGSSSGNGPPDALRTILTELNTIPGKIKKEAYVRTDR